MSNHVTEWLNAYLDGELKGGRLHQVEEHLAACEACQAELESIARFIGAVAGSPCAGVHFERTLCCPGEPAPASNGEAMTTEKPVSSKSGWWMIPVGLLAVWIFISTAILVSDMVSAANNFGLLDSATALLISDSSDNADVDIDIGTVRYVGR